MPKRISLKPEEYAALDKLVGLQTGEYYAIVGSKIRGKFVRSVHVFSRQPMTKELMEYESTASRTSFKGNKAKVDGSQIQASLALYNHLIARAYDVPVGWEIFGSTENGGKGLDREEAKKLVPALIKREAIRDAVSEHYSESRMSELDDDDDEKVVGAGATADED